jgi:hypothetical protein
MLKEMTRPIELIEQSCIEESKTCFTKEYQQTCPPGQLKEEGLGNVISKWADFDGTSIMRVFQSALENANFHQEAEEVGAMLEKYHVDDYGPEEEF